MNHAEIYRIALAAGFKLKLQPDRTMDLNPYVYRFAEALLEQGRQVALYHRSRAAVFRAERDEAARKWEEEKAEREALLAHVEWLDGLRRNVIEAIRDDRFEDLDVSFYRDDMQPEKPATSLARLVAEKKLAAIAEFHDRAHTSGDYPGTYWDMRRELRRQAEEAPSC